MAKPGPSYGLTAKQKTLIDLVASGMHPDTAKARVKITDSTWTSWRSLSKYPDFLGAFEAAYDWGKTRKADPPDFAAFRKQFLGLETPAHQQTWIKHLLHCDCKQLLILTAPESGKTTLIGRDLPAYLFSQEGARHSRGEAYIPHRIAYVTGSSKFAWDVGWQLQKLLTDRGEFEDIWRNYGPFKEEGRQRWSQQSIYMKWRDAAEKEPSMQWLGYSNQIQGKRLTLAILDDVDSATIGATDRASILRILYRVILQRLGMEGKLVMIGNRQDDNDIYSQILSSAPEAGWHVVVQQSVDADGEPFWDRYTKDYFAKKRAMVGEREFNLVYQQRSTPGPSALFRREFLDQCRIPELKTGEKFEGGLTIAALDPAIDGPWASIVVSVSQDRTKFRLLDLKVGKGGGYEAMREAVKWALTYSPHYFAIEKQGGLALFVGPEIRDMISKRNCSLELVPTTLQGLMDSYYGLAALALWFSQQKVEVPWAMGAAQRFRPLLDELEFYSPDSKAPKDRLMALDVETPLWTLDGWKTMGSVQVGDEVATPAGESAQVVYVTEVQREPVWRFEFGDGSSLRASASHRWWARHWDKGEFSWWTTEEIVRNPERPWRLQRPAPLDLPEVELPLDPYVLGVWLGDGDARQGTIASSERDIAEMRAIIENAGYKTGSHKRHGGKQSFSVLGVRRQFVALGLFGNKHIPEAYLRASLKQRLRLLQGLMDTDGCVVPGRARCMFGNTNKNLVDGVAFLARSLGFRPNVQAYGTTENVILGRRSPVQPFWRVLFTADETTLNPFHLSRKAERCSWKRKNRFDLLTLRDVRPDGEAEVRCITVDHPSHQFLAGTELVPTGNSLWFAFRVALTKGPILLPGFGTANQRYPWMKAQQRSVSLDDMQVGL